MISNPTWDAIILLLSSDYPDLTRGKLEKALAMEENEKKLEYIGTKEACKILNCSRRTIIRWGKYGYIRVARPSKIKTLYNLDDIEKKLNKQQLKPKE